MEILERISGESAGDYAYRVIRHNIVTLQLEPGCLVSEAELAKELELSRTPLREALIKLSKTYVVEIIPQRGSRVSLIDEKLVDASRFFRLAIEKAAVEQICDTATEEDLMPLLENVNRQRFYLEKGIFTEFARLDDKFHAQLFEICDVCKSYKLIKETFISFERFRHLNIGNTVVRNVNEHEEIVNALMKRDKEKACEILTRHLSWYKKDMEEYKVKFPHYFK